ncbi:DUF1707 domain-containing protein [Actinomadura sp. WMMA1423]|uniref:DUF1707 SHOCT-like domain-containing protein n=1 Tax=Actinomadura sp. WMMA1423 TaxID=2591108 RepID=UPI00114700D8|nr:DUF1707 domain-containing protein [Actinomadura sp. WMMA1423]
MPRHDETARHEGTAPHDQIRIGDAERDAVMVALHDHFAEGRLDRAELDERLEAVLSSKTRGELRALVRDLPSPTGLPDPPREARPEAPFGEAWGPGMAVMFGGPGHPAWHRHQRHMARHHRHMAHRRRPGPLFPAFPVLFAVFMVLAFTAGPGTGLLVALQLALAVWIVRAVLLAFGVRRARRHAPGA